MSPPAAAAPSSTEFRAVMGRWATGVSVVTSADGGHDAGLTVNAFLSVSLQPPSVLVSLGRDTDTLPVIERSRVFGVSVLRAEQRALSERFARTVPAAEKFEGVAVRRGALGVPLLDGALGTLECRLVSSTPAFDHHLLLGEVVAVGVGPDGPPLVFFRSGYAVAEAPGRLALPRPPSGSPGERPPR